MFAKIKASALQVQYREYSVLFDPIPSLVSFYHSIRFQHPVIPQWLKIMYIHRLKGSNNIRLFSYTSSKEKRGYFSRSRTSGASLIDGLLHRARLDDSFSQPYIALSYIWESPFPLRLSLDARASNASHQTIKCDGMSLAVGRIFNGAS